MVRLSAAHERGVTLARAAILHEFVLMVSQSADMHECVELVVLPTGDHTIFRSAAVLSVVATNN